MENLNQFEVVFERNQKPIIMLVPFWEINMAHDHVWDVVGKRPKSFKRL